MHVVHRCRFTDWQPASVNALAFNSSGTRLAVVRGNGDIELWENFASSATSDNKSDKEEISKYLAKHPISQNPVTLAASLSFPNITQWHCYHTIMGNGQPLVTSIYWTHIDKYANPLLDEKDLKNERLFTTSLTGQLIEWDINTYLPIYSVESYGGAVWCSSLSPSGTQIALGCHDGTVRIFDISQVNSPPAYLKALQKHRKRVTCIDWLQHSHIAPPMHGKQAVSIQNKNPNVSNSTTVVDSSAWWDTPLIITGSEDGHIHVWNTITCTAMSVIKTDLVRQQVNKRSMVEKQKKMKDLEADLQDGDYMSMDDDEDEEDDDMMEDIGFIPGSKQADLFGKLKNKPVVKMRTQSKRLKSLNGLVSVRWIDSETAVASDSKGQVHFVNCRMGSIQDTMVLHAKMGVITSIVIIPSSQHTKSVQHAFNDTYTDKYAYQRLYHNNPEDSTPSVGVTFPYVYFGGATGRVLQYIATPKTEDSLKGKNVFFGHECKWMETGAHQVHTHDINTMALTCISSNKVSIDKPLLLVTGGVDTGLVFYSAVPSTSNMAGNPKTGLLNNTTTSFQFLRPTRITSLPPRQTVYSSQYAAITSRVLVPSNYHVFNTAHALNSLLANNTKHQKLINLAPLSDNGNIPQIVCMNRIIKQMNKVYSAMKKTTETGKDKERQASLLDAYPSNAPTKDLITQLVQMSPAAPYVIKNAPKVPRIASFDGFEISVYTLGNTQDVQTYLPCKSKDQSVYPSASFQDELGNLTSLVSNQGYMAVDVASIAMNVIKTGKVVPHSTNTPSNNTLKAITEEESEEEVKVNTSLQPSILHRVLSATTHNNNKDRDEEEDEGKAVDVVNVKYMKKTGDGKELNLAAPQMKLASIGLSSKMRMQAGTLSPNGHLIAVSDSIKIRLFALKTFFTNIAKESEHATEDDTILVERLEVIKCKFPPMPPTHILKNAAMEYKYSCISHILTNCGSVEFAFSKDSSMLAISTAGLSSEAYEYTNTLATNKRVPIANAYKNAVYLIDLTTYQVINVISNENVLNLDSWLTGVEDTVAPVAADNSSDDSDSDNENAKKKTVSKVNIWTQDNYDEGKTASIARHMSFSACGQYLMTTNDESIVSVYNLSNNTLVCTLPMLPHPVTAIEMLPIPVLSSQGTFVGSDFFNLAAICKNLFKEEIDESSLVLPSSKKGRASALFATKSKPSKDDEGTATDNTSVMTPQQVVLKNLITGLKGLQQSLNTPVLSTPCILGCLSDGSFFIYDTASKSFITQNCIDNPASLVNPSFAPLPFPSKMVDVVSTLRASEAMSAKLSQKERVIHINVSNQPLVRRMKISVPANVIGDQTKDKYIQAYIPCISLMLQSNSFTFHVEIPATCLLPQLISQILRVATQNAMKRKENANAPKQTFASMCNTANKFVPKMKLKIIQRFKPLLSMGYADPVYSNVAAATLEYFKDINEKKDKNQSVMIPSPQVVVVEASWLNILSQLPDKVYKKKYGQM